MSMRDLDSIAFGCMSLLVVSFLLPLWEIVQACRRIANALEKTKDPPE